MACSVRQLRQLRANIAAECCSLLVIIVRKRGVVNSCLLIFCAKLCVDMHIMPYYITIIIHQKLRAQNDYLFIYFEAWIDVADYWKLVVIGINLDIYNSGDIDRLYFCINFLFIFLTEGMTHIFNITILVEVEKSKNIIILNIAVVGVVLMALLLL